MNKNIYKAPVCEYIKLDIDAIMVDTSPRKDTTGGGFASDQTADENIGGSWENIWNE